MIVNLLYVTLHYITFHRLRFITSVTLHYITLHIFNKYSQNGFLKTHLQLVKKNVYSKKVFKIPWSTTLNVKEREKPILRSLCASQFQPRASPPANPGQLKKLVKCPALWAIFVGKCPAPRSYYDGQMPGPPVHPITTQNY